MGTGVESEKWIDFIVVEVGRCAVTRLARVMTTAVEKHVLAGGYICRVGLYFSASYESHSAAAIDPFQNRPRCGYWELINGYGNTSNQKHVRFHFLCIICSLVCHLWHIFEVMRLFTYTTSDLDEPY